ncbi:MAG: 5-dehydro-4-deoxy-D-glucuronate isomerase [Verrucomicrobiales bacterium]
MRTVNTSDRHHYRRMTTEELRSHFLLENLFQPGVVELVYTDLDRAVVGGIVPLDQTLQLQGGREMACEFFCERREAGVLNLGAPGTITVDGTSYQLAPLDCLYISRGSREIIFISERADEPAQFYLVSYPAHSEYPTTQMSHAAATRIELGNETEANRRTIYQYIHRHGIPSCQLVMGFTELHPGSVWNTFPPHTHDRRTEIYCYFDLAGAGLVMHFLGEPDETRHVTVRDKQAVLSPPWSLHLGCGTAAYRFAWAMGGENQVFEDMDKVDLITLR